MKPIIKPRIHRVPPSARNRTSVPRYRCIGSGSDAYGPTPALAFERWEKKHLARQETLAAAAREKAYIAARAVPARTATPFRPLGLANASGLGALAWRLAASRAAADQPPMRSVNSRGWQGRGMRKGRQLLAPLESQRPQISTLQVQEAIRGIHDQLYGATNQTLKVVLRSPDAISQILLYPANQRPRFVRNPFQLVDVNMRPRLYGDPGHHLFQQLQFPGCPSKGMASWLIENRESGDVANHRSQRSLDNNRSYRLGAQRPLRRSNLPKISERIKFSLYGLEASNCGFALRSNELLQHSSIELPLPLTFQDVSNAKPDRCAGRRKGSQRSRPAGRHFLELKPGQHPHASHRKVNMLKSYLSESVVSA
ncbi:hypothetical protein ANT2_1657 [plant metagenome]|uniref:Uncharacterized protein n=1 Tax=plant metagenome TaxID=1297885 RepID=A0A484R397_9ZZZZ